MGNFIESKIIGQLKQDDQFNDWWRSAPIVVAIFDHKEIPFVFIGLDPLADAKFLEEADAALNDFLSLTLADRDIYSELVYENCTKALEELGYEMVSEELANLQQPSGIWKFVHPFEVIVSRRHRGDFCIYVAVSCGCEWEEEHGLQLVFKEGKRLTRISGHDGHLTEADAYDKPDEDDKLLTGFNSSEMGGTFSKNAIPSGKKTWWQRIFGPK